MYNNTDDDNRVKLKSLSGREDCQHDYINASYIDVSVHTTCIYTSTMQLNCTQTQVLIVLQLEFLWRGSSCDYILCPRHSCRDMALQGSLWLLKVSVWVQVQ